MNKVFGGMFIMKKRKIFVVFIQKAKGLRHRSTVCSMDLTLCKDHMQLVRVLIVTLFDHIGKGHDDYFIYTSRKPNIFDV